MQKTRGSFIALVIIVLIIGFLSGIVGELWLNSFLMPNSYINFKSYSDLSHKLDELIGTQNKTKNLQEQDLLVSEAINKVRPAIVSIYRDKKFTTLAGSSLLPSDYLGQGIIVTNDGWIVSHIAALKNDKSPVLIVTNDREVLKTEKIVSDTDTGVVFLKIAANGLSVAEFNLKENLVVNQEVFVFGPNRTVTNSSIRDLNFSIQESADDLVRESEVFYKFIQLNDNALNDDLGSPVVTLDGRVSGLVISKTGLVLPLDHLVAQMRAAIKNETWARPYLGIRFYDLSEILNSQIKDKQGVLIASNLGIQADSPAKGVLAAGDIVLEVEREELSVLRNLSELLATYHVGDKIKMKIKRGTEVLDVEVTLGKINK
ncbi:MAG: 2-alkenal reductase [Parcubacteria group bacterium GW2011_GWC2_39_14]|nr:MAG: 2-alkenal reductase [Parcubacteria group bacterium GW2011_GWC2_39_14]KKR54953.1 MAG: 2-alkenal reductase [Parcubacteria group bacterium GW2011_GWA2_40_23]